MGPSRDRRLIVLLVFALIAVGRRRRGPDRARRRRRRRGDHRVGGRRGLRAGRSRPSPKQVSLDAPKQEVQRGDELTAVVETSCGTFEIALDTERAPKTVNSFAFLAEQGFYDGLTFHRIAAPAVRVIQGGDPAGNGTGGPGYSVDEKPPANLAYTKGVVAMAKSSAEPPGRSGSQFFVVTSADLGLPPALRARRRGQRAASTSSSGSAAWATPDEQPKQTVLIDSVTIEEG